ncbi:MAG TPA: PLP-dependent aminotransferase family protein [Ilumatobacter sp.]|nr:PLP-dependent aminotransferase family protein [Ilumatobacter sp.]
MRQSISAQRLVPLVGAFSREPAYAGLATAIQLLIGDGRLAPGIKLPSERELTDLLGVSRTTVSAAYAQLRDDGYALARHGSGTFTALPAHIDRALDRALMPGGRLSTAHVDGTIGGAFDGTVIDLNCAATSAAAGLANAYARAATEIPGYLSGHGYFPGGLPALQDGVARSFSSRGLPTIAEQIIITPGALSAVAIAAHALCARGDKVLVENPVYPNAANVMRRLGARFLEAPVVAGNDEGWDIDALADTIATERPKLAYLVPEFQNPTGHLMTDAQRRALAEAFARGGTTPIIDEAHHALLLDGDAMPAPFASYAPNAITVGSASKSVWGGLRVGWIRAPLQVVPRLIEARLALDLGVPVFEQLVMTHVLDDFEAIISDQHDRLRVQRDALVDAVTTELPDWSFRVPAGGLCLWCELPRPVATHVVAAAESRGVIVAPGPVFATSGGLNRFIRIPWTRPAEELASAVSILADAWRTTLRQSSTDRPAASDPDQRVMVA